MAEVAVCAQESSQHHYLFLNDNYNYNNYCIYFHFVSLYYFFCEFVLFLCLYSFFGEQLQRELIQTHYFYSLFVLVFINEV